MTNKLSPEKIALLSDDKWLKHEYYDALKTAVEISIESNISYSTITRCLRIYNIARPQRLRHRLALLSKENYIKLHDYEWMYIEYIINKRTSNDIALELGTTYTTVIKVLRELNIEVRSSNVNKHMYHCKKILDKIDDFDWMWCQYIDKNRSLREIGQELDVKGDTIQRALTRLGITLKEYDKSYWMTGCRNPQWRGGDSTEYCYKFNTKFKEQVRNKFNRKCFECNKIDVIKKHHVHHIDYNKNSICNGKEWAFVPLCAKCHNKTHINRWYWFNKYIYYWLEPYIEDGIKFYDI
jgi:hypothetical protein